METMKKIETNEKINIGCISPIWVIVFLAFFCAKIFGYIDWSWWWIFAPIWIPLSICIILVVVVMGLKIWLE